MKHPDLISAMLGSNKKAQIVAGEKPFTSHEKRKHEEADLHLAFCKWVRLQYPNLCFIRHEREQKRTPYMQNLFKIYNSDDDKMPDFELVEPVYVNITNQQVLLCRLYIEFKKPGTILTLRDGKTIKAAYADQYKRHRSLWAKNSPAYFCSSFEDAQELLRDYLRGNPLPMQEFLF